MQSASRLIQQGDNACVVTHIHKLSKLQKWLISWLPEPLNQHCQVVNLRQDTLILSADSSVWATRLRYFIPQINARLDQEITDKPLKIQVKIIPNSSTPKACDHKKTTFSAQTGQLIQQMANTIDHPELSQSLAKLTAHCHKI